MTQPDPNGARTRVSSDVLAATQKKKPWGYNHYLGLLGLAAIAWQVWSYGAWLSKGPRQLTEYRDTETTAWTVARIFEVIVIVMAIAVLVFVIKQVRRERRLTFDAMVCIAGVTVIWLDPMANFAQPTFLYSSNWVNLNSWCGDVPLRINPTCGDIPQPMIFSPMLYIFGMLALLLLFNAVMRVAKRRWPDISAAKMFFWVLGAAMIMDVIIQVPAILLRLWAFPNLPISLFSQDIRYPLADLFGFSPFFATMAMLRFYKDDRGRTIIERGLDHLTARRRTLISLLALIGFANAAYVVFSLPDVWTAPYSSYMAKNTPAHLMNGICDDATTVKGSEYGLCPGMPGYKMPLRDMGRYADESE